MSSPENTNGIIYENPCVKDELDRVPYCTQVTNWDIFLISMSIITHVADVGFDIHIAYRYYHNDRTEYFIPTLIFILFPAFVNTFMSARMYFQDEDSMSVAKVLSKKWFIRIVILIFQLAPILRYCESLNYALKARKAEKKGRYVEQKMYYELMLKEDSDVALLRVIECFLEAAPQQILQITILLLEGNQKWAFQYFSQICSIVSSLCSMAWSMASYHRTIRFVQENKNNINMCGTVLQFLWHFMVTVSRILSITAVASVFPFWTTIACVIHWCIMVTWLMFTSKLVFCVNNPDSGFSKHVGELLFASILGMIYIFTFITPQSGKTRFRYLFYYLLCFVENMSAVIIWNIWRYSTLHEVWYFYPFTIVPILMFVMGIVFMMTYYKYFHPAINIHRQSSMQEKAVQTHHFSNLIEMGH